MAGDEFLCRVAIIMLAPAFGEHVFLLGSSIELGISARYLDSPDSR